MVPKLFLFSKIFGFCIFTTCLVNLKMHKIKRQFAFFRSIPNYIFTYNFTLIGQAVSEKKIFEKCVWMTDRPRSGDDLDFAIKLSSPLPMDASHKISL